MVGDILLLIAIFGPFLVLGWAAIRAKHRGLGGSFVGPFQEMFDPGAARAQMVVEQMADLPDPSESGDPDSDDVPYTVVYKGVRIRIDPGEGGGRGRGGSTE